MVNVAHLFSWVYCMGFFIANFSCDGSAIEPSITDAAFSDSAIEDIQDRSRRPLALLVPLEDDGSDEEHHKSKRCWKARPLRKMRLSCDPNRIYRTNGESTRRFRYSRKNLVGSNNMMEEEQVPQAKSYVKIVHDLYGDEKRPAEESQESWNSNESSGDNSAGKIPLLRLAPIKNPNKNLKGLFRMDKKSQDDNPSNEYDENSEDLILKKIKDHLNSNDYNVLALVGKRADHSGTENSKKYFCYCSEPNCPRSNCQRITYRPCLTRKHSKPIFVGGANKYLSNNGETGTVHERIPINVQYPVPKNHYNEYSMDNKVQLKNNQRVSLSMAKPFEPDAVSEVEHTNLQNTQPAFVDSRTREFYYGNPRRTFHVNQRNDLESNRNQYSRTSSASGSGVSSGLSNQYLVSQPKAAIGHFYPAIPVQENFNSHQAPYGQWAINSYNPLTGRRTGNQIPSYDNQMITQDSFKARDTHTEFVDSTVPITSQKIISSSQQLGTMQPKAGNLHPISNYAYTNEFGGNSHRSGDGFGWNVPNGMRSYPYYPQQYHYQGSFQELTPGSKHAINNQGAPEPSSNLGEDSTSLEDSVELDKEESDSLDTDEEMNTRSDFEDAGLELSTESNLGAKASSEMINENKNHSDESADNNTEDKSDGEGLKDGNEDSRMTIDDSKSTEVTQNTAPLIPHENLAHAEYPQNVNRLGDSVKISSSYEDVNDEDQRYGYSLISSENIRHSSSDEFRDTSSSYELIGSRNEVGENDAQHSIQDHNHLIIGDSIDEPKLRTQIERPMEGQPAWNQYHDYEGLSDPVKQPENNYRINPNRHPMIDYNQFYNRPRLDQYPNFFSHTNGNDGLFYQFPAQGMPKSKWNSEWAEPQPNYTGMKKTDQVFIGSSKSAERPVWKDNDDFDRDEETNEYFTAHTHEDGGEMSDKNIETKEVESTPSTHFLESVAKSSDHFDPRYDPKQYDGNGYTTDYEDQSFDTSHEIKSSIESDLEEDHLSVTTDATQSKGDNSDEKSLTIQGHETLDHSDAVFTESGEQNTEDGTKTIHGTDSESSREIPILSGEKIVGEIQPIEIQERNENTLGESESEGGSTNLNSQRISEALISSEKSSSEVLGEELIKSVHGPKTIEAKDNYKSHSSIEEQTSKSNEEMIEEYDDEDMDEENEPSFPVGILKNKSTTVAENELDKTKPEHIDTDGDKAEKYLGEGRIDSYEGDDSHSKEDDRSVYSTQENPTAPDDENSENVGAAKTCRAEKISSCPVFNGREIPIENSPTKYFSPNDRRLEYIKKHSANLLASKYSTAAERDEQHVDPVMYHTQRSEPGSQSDEIGTNLSQSEGDWYDDDQSKIPNINYETAKSGASHEFAKDNYNVGKNKQAVSAENDDLIHLTENRGKNSKTFKHYEDHGNPASNSESDAAESDELYKTTYNDDTTLSSILEHRKITGPSHEISNDNYIGKNQQVTNRENNDLIRLTENGGKSFKVFEHYEDHDNPASNSESDASESDKLHKTTYNDDMTLSSILEHRKITGPSHEISNDNYIGKNQQAINRENNDPIRLTENGGKSFKVFEHYNDHDNPASNSESDASESDELHKTTYNDDTTLSSILEHRKITGPSHEISKDNYIGKNQQATNRENNNPIRLTENGGKSFKVFEHYNDHDNPVFNSDSDASESDELYRTTYNDDTTLSSILEHRKITGPSHEISKDNYIGKNQQAINRENNDPIRLTENGGKSFKVFEHYEDHDNPAFNSDSDASESDELYRTTYNDDTTVSSILEHKKNLADDQLTQNYEDATSFTADTQTPLKIYETTQIAEKNEEDLTESFPVEVVGGIWHRDNPENEELLTSIEYPKTSDSTESHEQKYDNAFSNVKDSKKNEESAEVVEAPKKSISKEHDHSLTGSIERSVNLGNSKGLSSGSSYHEEKITHLQKESSHHDYDYSASTEDLEPSEESGESITDHSTENSSVPKYTSPLHNGKGKVEPTLGKTSTCGCSAVSRKVTTDGDQNGKRISVNDFLTSSHHADEVEMVTIKHRENYNSAEETASSIETEEKQSQEILNRESGEINADENLSAEFDKKIHDLSTVNTDQYVGVQNPATQSTTRDLSSEVKMDQDEEVSQYLSESEEKQYSKLSHSYENGRHADMRKDLSTIGEKTFLEDRTEDVAKRRKAHTDEQAQSVKNLHSVNHGNTHEELSSSVQVETNHKSKKFSSEVKSAEFIGSAHSLQHGSCTKPPEVHGDIGYLGRLAPKNSNAKVTTLGDLIGSDLYYIGDGVRLPLTIKKLKDGSFALSISDKICEARIAEKCPCCVPREGKILQEKRGEFNAAEPVDEIDFQGISADGKTGTNEELLETSETRHHGGLQLERNERALDVHEESRNRKRATRSITMPVDEFIEKYNLNLNLDDVQQQPEHSKALTEIESRLKHNVIRKDKAKDVSEEQNSSLVHKLASINEVPQNVSANALLTTFKNLISTKPANIHVVIDEIKNELSDVTEVEKSGKDNSEKETSRTQNDRYGYQRGNLILDRIAVIKKLQDKKYRCEHRYQKDCDDAITEKTKLLTTILYWLKNLATDQQN